MIGAISRIFFVFILGVIFIAPANSQKKKPEKSYLLTGVILDLEEKKPLPYVNINLKNSIYGTASDINGYFSIFLNPGDTLEFTSVGYEDASFIMPFELQEQQYALLQLMRKDTLLLEEVVIFPWPDYNNFVDAFLDMKPKKNMGNLVIEVRQDIQQTAREAERSRYYYQQQRYQRLFLMHQIFPPNNFLDPGRWSDFIKDLRTDDKEQEE